MGRRIWLLTIGVLAVTATIAIGPSATAAPSGAATAAAAPAYPSSMAALGDSITRAYDVCCSYADHPANSWSTGTDASDGITSQYERLLALNSAISGRAANLAVAGAKMAAGPTQAADLTADVQYVTILLGANDVCTSSSSTMTPTATFRSQSQSTLDQVHAKAPNALVFVSSIPNIYQLWSTLHGNFLAQSVWAAAKICQSMLALTNTSATRSAVAARETEFNNALRDTCTSAAYSAFCRWDDLATYDVKFSAGQVSTLDYFHPNKNGQAVLANTTWTASYWG
jgi:lysophospholipase L1-like esterase